MTRQSDRAHLDINSIYHYPRKPLLVTIIIAYISFTKSAGTTSINYGISQQPITDISQLMPKLCQNQSVICEGSFCIPGVRKCVCDLRMPVQLGKFCLRQVDIETKCFFTSQCNHTIKDSVCIDMNSNAVLDIDSSMFKLEQWHQLNELRRKSQSALSSETTEQTTTTTTMTPVTVAPPRIFLADNSLDELNFEARDDVIISNLRNSPYEINYSPELIQQNHTRRKINPSDQVLVPLVPTSDNEDIMRQIATQGQNQSSSRSMPQSDSPVPDTTTRSVHDEVNVPMESRNFNQYSQTPVDSSTPPVTTTTMQTNDPTQPKRKTMVVKTPNWPPGMCLCPHGFMFDSMLRKCLALSLADSHCSNDNDCKQISRTHCSMESKKCDCDEPLVWNQTDLACVRPMPLVKTSSSSDGNQSSQGAKEGFIDNLIPPLVLAKLLPDQTVLLLIFVILVIIGTLIILKLTVKCFSSSGSALVSPTKHQKNRGKSAANNNNNSLPPRSPYATLKRPEHKPTSQLSNFTQATRGRILNYDFEQDAPIAGEPTGSSPQPPLTTYGTISNVASTSVEDHSTLSKNKSHKHHHHHNHHGTSNDPNIQSKQKAADSEQLLELNDNVSLGQLESEGKSESSAAIMSIPGPSPNQPPPYMLPSAMKGQGSAIAAAAAAVANRRIQMAQKKNLDQQQQPASAKKANGSPVFL